MGCSTTGQNCEENETPQHRVILTNSFWIGQTPVTVAAFKKFMGATGFELEEIWSRATTPYSPLSKGNDFPIDFLTWEEARAYCCWMGGRLPTEAEWEYAARAGSREPLYGSLDDIAWNSRGHPVGQKLPNAWDCKIPSATSRNGVLTSTIRNTIVRAPC